MINLQLRFGLCLMLSLLFGLFDFIFSDLRNNAFFYLLINDWSLFFYDILFQFIIFLCLNFFRKCRRRRVCHCILIIIKNLIWGSFNYISLTRFLSFMLGRFSYWITVALWWLSHDELINGCLWIFTLFVIWNKWTIIDIFHLLRCHISSLILLLDWILRAMRVSGAHKLIVILQMILMRFIEGVRNPINILSINSTMIHLISDDLVTDIILQLLLNMV